MTEPITSDPQETNSGQPEPNPGSTRGLVIGFSISFTLILAVIGYLIYSSQSAVTRNPVRPVVADASGTTDPYAALLKLTDIHMLEAQNMIGGKSYYIEGKVTNTGKGTVTGATVEITFHNSLGEVSQREQRSLNIVLRRQPAIDVGAMNLAPLKPGESREFQIAFERITQDWNGQYPEVRVVTAVVQ